eukprot:TRINITY_DN3279_c0_g1_i1.p1 TRINITY_DN3279_c0_g1~~TRINITY_DN3279_c0_g1_i1.p1  ORF type:complete len:331 (+),score=72.47 TRINITY_DN3279_c0_g1_i1:127-993(+)
MRAGRAAAAAGPADDGRDCRPCSSLDAAQRYVAGLDEKCQASMLVYVDAGDSRIPIDVGVLATAEYVICATAIALGRPLGAGAALRWQGEKMLPSDTLADAGVGAQSVLELAEPVQWDAARSSKDIVIDGNKARIFKPGWSPGNGWRTVVADAEMTSGVHKWSIYKGTASRGGESQDTTTVFMGVCCKEVKHTRWPFLEGNHACVIHCWRKKFIRYNELTGEHNIRFDTWPMRVDFTLDCANHVLTAEAWPIGEQPGEWPQRARAEGLPDVGLYPCVDIGADCDIEIR